MIGSQLIGYGLAGIMRIFLVYPTFAVYPQLIPTVQLFDTLHRGKSAVLQKKRMRFFWSLYVIHKPLDYRHYNCHFTAVPSSLCGSGFLSISHRTFFSRQADIVQ